MLSIQELGLQILGNSPKNLYILCGPEYGIKQRYIEHLTEYYGRCVEAPSACSIIDQMKQKHVIPLDPAVYIVRYDTDFVSKLDSAYAVQISKAKISGTIVCLYESDKFVSKFDKFLPDNTAILETVNPKFVTRYLHEDFPKLDDRSIKIAVSYTSSYGHARVMCSAMNMAPPEKLARMSEIEVAECFGSVTSATDTELQQGIASRDFNKLMHLITRYDDDLDRAVYAVLQTMIELEKLQCSKYAESPLRPYLKLWKPQDIYYMFMNGYHELEKLRSTTGYSAENCLTYLFGLLKFRDIPSPEVMKE